MMHLLKLSTPVVLLFLLAIMVMACTSESTDTTSKPTSASEATDTTSEPTGASEATDTTSEPTGASESPVALSAPDGSTGKAHNDEGVEQYKQAHWDQAEGHFSQAIEADPNLAEAHYNLALALDKLGKHGAATESFKKAASLAPDNSDITESSILKQHTGG